MAWVSCRLALLPNSASLGILEEDVRTRAQICTIASQNELLGNLMPRRFDRLPKHQKGLYHATFPHAVQTAQQRQRRTRQLQVFKTLEVR